MTVNQLSNLDSAVAKAFSNSQIVTLTSAQREAWVRSAQFNNFGSSATRGNQKKFYITSNKFGKCTHIHMVSRRPTVGDTYVGISEYAAKIS
jgi:hypothetical protein